MFDFEAAAVGAPHRRERVAFVANRAAALENANRERCEKFHPSAVAAQAGCTDRPAYVNALPDTDNGRGALRRHGELSAVEEKGAGRRNHAGGTPQHGSGERGPTQSRLGGGNDGLPGWMDSVRNGWVSGAWESDIPRISEGAKERVNRLKCLGNAVVPQQFYPIFKAIREVEKGIR